ncbi:hypothetical protein N752_02520 [Desulforamulus aquiferis]|nr:Ig-like domain-containing protein [Desulforamulus aquiferis]RYD06560.1 hypothetical protein N752_02520 [Desulforamulus aquiferis]
MIWPLWVWASGEFQAKVPLRFVGIDNRDSVPSKGPVIIQFNTEVNPGELMAHFKGPKPGRLEPVKYFSPEGYLEDYSRWQYWPESKLNNTQDYTIHIAEGLPSRNGGKLTSNIEAQFTTTPEFLILESNPRPGSSGIWLTRNIFITANQDLKTAEISINDLPGVCRIDGNRVDYLPNRVLSPNTHYKVTARLVSKSNEILNYSYDFITTNLGSSRWLEIKSGSSIKLWVMEGKKTIRTMTITQKSRPAAPTGTLYEQNRSTTSNKNSKQDQWIWLNADILLHSLPEGTADNHSQLGIPKTYSCYYLEQEDLDWLISYMPQGFMVINH